MVAEIRYLRSPRRGGVSVGDGGKVGVMARRHGVGSRLGGFSAFSAGRVLAAVAVLVASLATAPVAGASSGLVPGGPGSDWVPISFAGWSSEGGSSHWTVSPDGSTAVENINGDATFLVSPQAGLSNYEVRGTIEVGANWDNDFLGLAFGYQHPVAADGDLPSLMKSTVFAWKQGQQSWEDPTVAGGSSLAPEGYSLAAVDGSFANSASPLWHNSSGTQVLASNFGPGTGWKDGVAYSFRAQYTPSSVTVWVNDVVVVSVAGTFDPGRFALFTWSQQDTRFSNFEWRSLSPAVTVQADAGPDQSVARP